MPIVDTWNDEFEAPETLMPQGPLATVPGAAVETVVPLARYSEFWSVEMTQELGRIDDVVGVMLQPPCTATPAAPLAKPDTHDELLDEKIE